MSLANRPLPWWLVPVLLGVVAAQIAVELVTHRTVPTLLSVLSIAPPTWIALDSVGTAGKRRLRAQVEPTSVFTVAFDRTAATRLGALGEGSLSDERALLVAGPAALEFWTEAAHPKRVLAIAWERLAGASVESNDSRTLHTIALQVPEADPLILDVARPLHERLRHRAATAAEVAARIQARLGPAKVG
jgi:hypothetical protein